MSDPGRLLDRIDPASVLEGQRLRKVNFDPAEVDDTWSHDLQHTTLGKEPPGPPVPQGIWETACRFVAAYEMADPSIIRAVYKASAPLVGRDLLLEGRFLLLRFYMGVRITEVIDERRGTERTWGWAYETLEGHVERGRMSYEVVKDERSGLVELVIRAYSEGASTLGPVTALGWRLFGRRTQLRFYRECGRRLRRLVEDRQGYAEPVPERRTVNGYVLAPSDAVGPRRAVLSIRRSQPG
jgi:uncharacterized protein (UPF0548 family)